ncbi:MAG: glycosyltransferase family 2 protein [Acidobacteria bacterium]|nr:MAG: glycosyltransferase family 2 protein [Acidobacteriota bacterium]
MNPLLSVVIPAFNEEARLGSTLEKVLAYLDSRRLAAEIVLVDDSSEDVTFSIAQRFCEQHKLADRMQILRSSQNQGKGFSIRRGMQAARGAFALMTDADLSSPIEELGKLEREVIGGAHDIAFGSRALEDSVVALHQSWFRENSGKIFNRFVRLITGLPFHDTQCGFKLFKMSSCRALFEKQRLPRFGFDVELLYIASKWGLSMKEVPVVWRHAPGSKVRFATDAPRMFLDLFRIRWNDWRGYYER